MSFDDNKRIARRWFEEVINQRRLDAIDDIYAAGYVHHGPRGREMRGRDQIRGFAAGILSAFADRHATIEEQIAEGDTVATRFTSRGTQTGEFLGRPPSGKAATIEGIVISRIEGPKIAEEWEITDQLGFLQALGIVGDG
jgi:steroid delta-isomerase-like uncharacterized protein